MTGRPPIITGALREELWRRYKAGETILGIGRALDQRQATIHRVLQTDGGIAPARRSRSSRVLSFSECEEISRGIAAGCTFRAIARGLHRAVSTVSQEVAWHGDGRDALAVRRGLRLRKSPKANIVDCTPLKKASRTARLRS